MVIYRKYRPKTFKEFLGADLIKSALLNSIKNLNVYSSYLFTGSRGTGKTTLARLFAKAISCKNLRELNDVCNECDNCLSINNNASVDIIEIDAASNRGIDDMRNLRDAVGYTPVLLPKKIYIIDEVHMLTIQAFNALLKILEEPPKNVIFLLATTEPHKIPETILSRVIRFDLKLQTPEVIIGKLKHITLQEGFTLPDEVYNRIYEFTGGSFRDAETLLSKIFTLDKISLNSVTLDELLEFLGLPSYKEVEKFLNSITDFLNLQNSLDDIQKREYLRTFVKIFENSNSVKQLIDDSLNKLIELVSASKLDHRNFILMSSILLSIKKELSYSNAKSLGISIYLKLENTTAENTCVNVHNPNNYNVAINNNFLPTNNSQNIVINSVDNKKSTQNPNIINSEVALPKALRLILGRSEVTSDSKGKVVIKVFNNMDASFLNSLSYKNILKDFYCTNDIIIDVENVGTSTKTLENSTNEEVKDNKSKLINDSNLEKGVQNYYTNSVLQNINNYDLVNSIFFS